MRVGGPSQGPQAGPLSSQGPALGAGQGLTLERDSRPALQMPAVALAKRTLRLQGSAAGGVTPESFHEPSTGILWENTVTGWRAIWGMAGPVFTGEVTLFEVPPPWRIGGAGDLNGDGHDDIVWEHPQTGDRYIWFMEGHDLLSSVFLGRVDPAWQITAVADMNADGRADLIWQHLSSGDRYIWLMNGAQVIGSPFVGQVPPVWDIAAVGDFNADGLGDFVWQNTATGERYLWLMNVAQVLQAVPLAQVDPAWEIAGTGNFFGGTTSDILWQHRPSGWRSIWLMEGVEWSGTGAVLPVVDPQWNIVDAFGFEDPGEPPPPPPPGPLDGVWMYNVSVGGSVQGTPVNCTLQGMTLFLGHDEEEPSLFSGIGAGGTWDCGAGAEEVNGLLLVAGEFTAPNRADFAVGTYPLWYTENGGTLAGNNLTGPARLTVSLGPASVVLQGQFVATRLVFGGAEATAAARRHGLDAAQALGRAGIPTPPAGVDADASIDAAHEVLTRGVEKAVRAARNR